MAGSADVLVDSSVWIDFFGGDRNAVTGLRGLIDAGRVRVCGQILQEVLQGSRDERAFGKLSRQMAIWDSETEEPDDFHQAAHIFARLRWKGITIPPTDCLIAAMAIRRNLLLYTRDSDFDQVPGLQLYRPVPGAP